MEESDNEISEIQLLVFSVMGIRFGADMEQIDEMIEPARAEELQIDVVPFHELVPVGTDSVSYTSHRVLLIDFQGQELGIQIGLPENIINLPTRSIALLPRIVEYRRKIKAIWGVAFMNDEPVLMIDFYKLLTERDTQEALKEVSES